MKLGPARLSGRRPLLRVLAVLVGLVLLVGLLEGGLWVAHAFSGEEFEVELPPPEPGARTILCIGDSNTFGIHLERAESYPGQLQKLLDRAPDSPWRVVNAGYPSHNSAQVRARLARSIEATGAEIVIAWAGLNNTWSIADRHLWETPDSESEPGWSEAALQGLRVARLARIALDRNTESLADTRARLYERLEIDWRRIHALCRERGAQLLMCDYPVHFTNVEDNVNGGLHRIAELLDIPLVELHDELLPVFYGLGYERTMFQDYHANRNGNYEVARTVLAALLANDFLAARAEWSDVEPLWQRAANWPIRIVAADCERATVLLHGPADNPYALVLMATYTRSKNDKTKGEALPVAWYQALSPAELAERGFTGVLDEQGDCRVELALPPPSCAEVPDAATWLGWRLRVLLGSGPSPLEPDERTAFADVLLDPAVAPCAELARARAK